MASSLLDNFEEIRRIDKSDMLSFQVKAAQHFSNALHLARKVSLDYSEPENVIVAGMGGSAISGELLKDWARGKASTPIEISRDYKLPNYVGAKTLVIVSSYSGDTEETLSTFLDAKRRGCMIYCISSGGKLLEFAEKLNVPFLRVPPGMPPRAALHYLFVPLLTVLEKAGCVPRFSEESQETRKILEEVAKGNAPQNPSESNLAKTLALGIGDTVPVVYGFGIYRSVAQRFKQQFNENTKIPSKWESFSELDHNEIAGWEKAGWRTKHFSAICLRDKKEATEVRSRIEITKAIIEPLVSKWFEVWSQGSRDLSKMLSTILMGDFTSVYLAILQKTDPTPVQTITMLKQRLSEVGTRTRVVRELEELTRT